MKQEAATAVGYPALLDELEPIVRKADEWAHEHPDEWDDLDIFPDDMPDALADMFGLCTPAILGDLLAAARRSIELDVELASLRSRVELHRQKQADAEDALRKAQHGHNGMAHDRDRLRAENERLVSFLRTHGPDLMLYTKPQVEGLKRPCRDALGRILEGLK